MLSMPGEFASASLVSALLKKLKICTVPHNWFWCIWTCDGTVIRSEMQKIG